MSIIKSDPISYYIHLNPLGIKGSKAIASWREAFSFLEKYKWSSFPDYIGKKNFPSVTKRDFVLKSFGSETAYRRYTREFLRELQKDKEVWPELIHDFTLD